MCCGYLLLLVRSLLLDYDMRWFKVSGEVPHDRTARYKTVVVHADHRLKVLDLIWREYVEGSATDKRPNR